MWTLKRGKIKKKSTSFFFCSLSVNNSVHVNSHSKNISQQVPLVEQGSQPSSTQRSTTTAYTCHDLWFIHIYNHTQTHNRPVNQYCRSSWYMPQPQPHFPSDTPTDDIKQRLKMFISTLTNIYNILLYHIPIVLSKIMNRTWNYNP